MITAMPSASPLPPFTVDLLMKDVGRLAPVGVVVIILAALAVVVWLREQTNEPKVMKKSKKRGV